MARYSVRLARSARKELEALHPESRDRVLNALEALSDEARPAGCAVVCYDSLVAIATRAELLAALGEHAAEIRGLGAESLRLFGSFARGEQHPDSDLDLLVAFAPG